MALMHTIEFADKIALNSNSSVDDVHKCNASDLNEIKSVVNYNASNGDIQEVKITNISTFSTSEVNTSCVWINNSTIYRKVIDMGALPNATTKSVAHNISNLSNIISIKGIAIKNSESLPIPYVTFNANNSGGIIVYANDTDVVLTTSTDRSSYNGYIILEYTKSS